MRRPKGRLFAAAAVILAAVCTTAGGGVFLGTVRCNNPQSENFCVQGQTLMGQGVTPFAITHPRGYIGAGGALTLRVCVEPGGANGRLEGPTRRAIATWNALTPETGQCPPPCVVHEEPDPVPETGKFHAESSILHELGHCAMGLGHTDLEWDPPGGPDLREASSLTVSYGGLAAEISAGPDGIPGSFDDVHGAVGSETADSVHWFRISDNNPVIIDATVIDFDTYSRSTENNLPAGHSWAANANRVVAESLGEPWTQAVMYSRLGRQQRRTGLTADEVNMVKMARTGQDRMNNAGQGDDYTLTLQFVEDCAMADITVSFFPFGEDELLGACAAGVDLSFPQGTITARHYSVMPTMGQTTLDIYLNDFYEWETREEFFVDGFESGDTTAWDMTLP